MKQNKYQEAIAHIQTPPVLKENMRNMLLARTAKRSVFHMRWVTGVVAAALVLVAGLGIWLGMGDDLIVSNLVQGEHTEAVTLRDGVLYFQDLTTDDLVPPIRLAPAFPLRRNLSLEEYEGVLPPHVPAGLAPPEGGITAFFADPTDEPAAILGRVSYQAETGGALTVSFTNDSTLLALPIEIGGSQIAGVTVGVGFLEAEGAYYGAYLKDEYLFLLTAEGMEQRDFVRLLYDFISS